LDQQDLADISRLLSPAFDNLSNVSYRMLISLFATFDTIIMKPFMDQIRFEVSSMMCLVETIL